MLFGAHIFTAVVACTKTKTAVNRCQEASTEKGKMSLNNVTYFTEKKTVELTQKTRFCCPRTRKERQLEDLCNLMLKRIDATPGVFFLHNAKTHFGRRTNNIQ